MPPIPTPNTASERMRRIQSVNTQPERLFQQSLKSIGLRFKTSCAELPGKPDIVVHSKKVAIFIDGDFWHGGQWQRRDLFSLEDQFQNSNPDSKDYWLSKIRSNMERDFNSTSSLVSDGWTVVRFWESEINQNLDDCLDVVNKAINSGFSRDSIAHSLLPQRTVAEFFAGIGLMRMGLEKQGWSCVFSNDLDPQKYEMYKDNFENSEEHYVIEDVHKLPVAKVPTVTLATASFPCTDLSLAGGRQGLQGKQSSAFWGFVRVLEEMKYRRPPIVMLENVPGFLTSNGGKDFKQALMALNQLGYSVDAFVLDAVNFVPQSRARMFVIGVLENVVSSNGRHSQSVEPDVLRPDQLVRFINTHPEIKWRLQPLPFPQKIRHSLKGILETVPHTDERWWSQERSEYLLNQMSRRHQIIAKQMMRGGKWSYGTVFRRTRNNISTAELRVDGIAGCLRTPKGGSARQILFKAGKGKYFVRLMTPKEAAGLMGAAEYKINVPMNQALFGFGDAVCVSAVEWIAKYYLNPLLTNLIRHAPLKTVCNGK